MNSQQTEHEDDDRNIDGAVTAEAANLFILNARVKTLDESITQRRTRAKAAGLLAGIMERGGFATLDDLMNAVDDEDARQGILRLVAAVVQP